MCILSYKISLNKLCLLMSIITCYCHSRCSGTRVSCLPVGHRAECKQVAPLIWILTDHNAIVLSLKLPMLVKKKEKKEAND